MAEWITGSRTGDDWWSTYYAGYNRPSWPADERIVDAPMMEMVEVRRRTWALLEGPASPEPNHGLLRPTPPPEVARVVLRYREAVALATEQAYRDLDALGVDAEGYLR